MNSTFEDDLRRRRSRARWIIVLAVLLTIWWMWNPQTWPLGYPVQIGVVAVLSLVAVVVANMHLRVRAGHEARAPRGLLRAGSILALIAGAGVAGYGWLRSLDRSAWHTGARMAEWYGPRGERLVTAHLGATTYWRGCGRTRGFSWLVWGPTLWAACGSLSDDDKCGGLARIDPAAGRADLLWPFPSDGEVVGVRPALDGRLAVVVSQGDKSLIGGVAGPAGWIEPPVKLPGTQLLGMAWSDRRLEVAVDVGSGFNSDVQVVSLGPGAEGPSRVSRAALCADAQSCRALVGWWRPGLEGWCWIAARDFRLYRVCGVTSEPLAGPENEEASQLALLRGLDAVEVAGRRSLGDASALYVRNRRDPVPQVPRADAYAERDHSARDDPEDPRSSWLASGPAHGETGTKSYVERGPSDLGRRVETSRQPTIRAASEALSGESGGRDPPEETPMSGMVCQVKRKGRLEELTVVYA